MKKILQKVKGLSRSEEIKRLLSNFMSLSILQAFTYVLPLLTMPYLVRVLGTEKFGLVMFAQAFLMFFNILVDFGFNLSATREVAVHRDDKKKLTEIFSAVMTIKAFLLLLSFIILSTIIFSFKRFSADWALYYLTFLWVIGQALFPVWYFQGMERMRYITIVNITSKVIFTILIFVVIQVQSDYIYVPLINGFGFIVGGGISLWMMSKVFNQSFHLFPFSIIRKYFMDSAQYFLSRVSLTIYTSSNAFALGVFTNNTMVGYYAIAEKLYQALQQIYQPIVQVLYPYIAKHKNIILYKKLFTLLGVLNVLGIIFLYFAGAYIFDFLFTESIGSESLHVFHILLAAALVVVPSILLGYPFLGALGLAKYANLSVVYGSIFHLIGLIVLVLSNRINIYSVALMVLATESLVFGGRVYWIWQKKLWQKQ